MNANLTTRQKEIYDFILGYTQENGVFPTYQTIIDNIDGLSTKSAVHGVLKRMEERGAIERGVGAQNSKLIK